MTAKRTQTRGDRLRGLGQFLLLLFKRRAGWGYIHLARVGLGLVGLGVSLLIPGFWETILNWLLPRLGIADAEASVETAFVGETLIACVIIAAGLLLIFWSFRLYHRHVTTSGPSRENDGKISTVVQPGTTVKALIDAVGIEHEKTTDFSALSDAERRRKVLPGLLTADDFEQFLKQVAARAEPSLSLECTIDGKVYKLRTAAP